MAHHKSAIKRIKTNELRRQRNKANRTKLRNVIKQYRALISDGNAEEAKAQLPKLVSILNHSVSKGILHKATASRQVSRLTISLNKISA